MKNNNRTKSTKLKSSSYNYRTANNPLLNFQSLWLTEITENIPFWLLTYRSSKLMDFYIKMPIPKAKSKKGKPLVTKIKVDLQARR